MSVTSELQRISNARDKIREQLLKLSPNVGIPFDVIASANELLITAADADDNDVTYINANGTGQNGIGGASVKVRTKLAKGTYKFSYTGSEVLQASVSVADIHGNKLGIGLSGNNNVPSYNIYAQFAPNYSLKLGDDIYLQFSIDSSASINSFSIGVQRIAPLDENSKLDECALALEHYVANV